MSIDYQPKTRRSFQAAEEPAPQPRRVYRLDDGDLTVRDVVNLINLHQQNRRWWKRLARWLRRPR